MRIVASAGVCLVYSAACVCLGALMLRLLDAGRRVTADSSPLVALASAFLLGQGFLAGIWELVALAGMFSPSVVVGFLSLAAVAGAPFAWSISVPSFARARQEAGWFRAAPLVWKAVAFLTLVLIAMLGMAAILPPQARGDALAFYMALPKVISASHRLLPLPGYEAFTSIGLQGEFHFAALMSLRDSTAAKMFVWPTSLAAGLMLAAVGGQVGLQRPGMWVAVAALFSSTAFTSAIWDGKVDVFAVAMGMAAFYWALRVRDGRGPLPLRLAGLFTGLAIVAEISYVVGLLPGILILVVWHSVWKGGGGIRSQAPDLLSLTGRLGAWTILPLLPNVFKNTLLFEEPLAPLLSSASAGILNQSWYTVSTATRIILTYPFALVYGQFWGQGGNLSPLILAFSPLVVLLSRPHSLRESRLFQVGIAGLVGVALWVVYRPTIFGPRYILASLLVLILIGARGAEEALAGEKSGAQWLRGVATLVLVTSLGFGIGQVSAEAAGGLRIAAGAASECEFEHLNSDASCRIAQIVNEQDLPGGRVFLAAYYRYWLRPDIIQCVSRAGEEATLKTLPSMADRWAYFYESGFRYLIVDTLTHAYILDILDIHRAPEWLQVTSVYDSDGFHAYRLNASDLARPQLATCAQVDPPAWRVVPGDGS